MSAIADVDLLLAGHGCPTDAAARGTRGHPANRSAASATSCARSATCARCRPRPICPACGWWTSNCSGGAPPGVVAGVALLLVPEEHLARVVALLLRDAGFVVERVRRRGGARALGRAGSGLAGARAGREWRGRRPRARGVLPAAERAYRVVALVAGDARGPLGRQVPTRGPASVRPGELYGRDDSAGGRRRTRRRPSPRAG